MISAIIVITKEINLFNMNSFTCVYIPSSIYANVKEAIIAITIYYVNMLIVLVHKNGQITLI